ncbi:hypothetical protein ACJZ2D_002910 [Fusarium nematophilum]
MPLLPLVGAWLDRVRQRRNLRHRRAGIADEDRRALRTAAPLPPGRAGPLPLFAFHPPSPEPSSSSASSEDSLRPADAQNPLGLYPPASPPPVFPPGNQPGEPAAAGRAPGLRSILREAIVVPVVQAGSPTQHDQAYAQPWDIPGNDMYPMGETRHLNAAQFESSRRLYRVDEFLRDHTNLPEAPAEVFALLLETAMTANGFIGCENGLNLPLILSTLHVAMEHGMTREVENLTATIHRYICVRMFYHNPHDSPVVPNTDHYLFRSEEIHRSWLILKSHPLLSVQTHLIPRELTLLYAPLVPQRYWAAMAFDFEREFHNQVNEFVHKMSPDPEGSFGEVYLLFLRRSGLGMHEWVVVDDDASEQPSWNAREGSPTILSEVISLLRLPSPTSPVPRQGESSAQATADGPPPIPSRNPNRLI